VVSPALLNGARFFNARLVFLGKSFAIDASSLPSLLIRTQEEGEEEVGVVVVVPSGVGVAEATSSSSSLSLSSKATLDDRRLPVSPTFLRLARERELLLLPRSPSITHDILLGVGFELFFLMFPFHATYIVFDDDSDDGGAQFFFFFGAIFFEDICFFFFLIASIFLGGMAFVDNGAQDFIVGGILFEDICFFFLFIAWDFLIGIVFVNDDE